MRTRYLQSVSRLAAVTLIAAAFFSARPGLAEDIRPSLWPSSSLPPVEAGTMIPFGEPSDTVDAALVRRWAALFAAVLEAFRADHRDPTASIEGDFSTRLMRIRKGFAEESWATRALTEEELATADIDSLARELYHASVPAKRWALLVGAVLEVFRADGRDATANVEADFTKLQVRVRAGAQGAWVVRTLTERELASEDLPRAARRLYAAARSGG